MKLSIAYFKSASDNDPRQGGLTWPQLVAKLTAPHKVIPVPGLAELAPGSKEWKDALDKAKKTHPLFSPVLYKRGMPRASANVVSVSCFVADLDELTPSELAEIRKSWEGLAWCLYSSVKHRAEAPRLRVVFPLAAPVPASEWPRVWLKLTYHLTENRNDKAVKDAARMHFLPIVPAELSEDAISDVGEGPLLDPALFADPPAFEKVADLVKRGPAIGSASEVGTGKPGDDFNEKATHTELFALLQKHGWQEHSRKGNAIYVTRPGKDTHAGPSGVVGWPGDDTVTFHCFTSSFPALEARTYAPFGLLGTLEHGSRFDEAARELSAKGYGEQPGERTARAATQRYAPSVASDDDFMEAEPVEKKSASEGEEAPAKTEDSSPEERIYLTDLGNARRLISRHGKNLRYSPALGWLAWDGRRWESDDSGEVERWAKETVIAMYGEAAELLRAVAKETNEEKQDKLNKRVKALQTWAQKSQGAKELGAMQKLAKTEPGVYVPICDLDSSPWLLNCQNGTLDLRTGTLQKHRREDLLTKALPVAYDPEATCPTWEKFLLRVLPDPEVRGYVQRATGYALTADVGEQCLFFFYGDGSNGKSTFLKTLLALLTGYGQQAPADLLIVKTGNSIPNDVAGLRGARFVATIEVEDGKRMAEGLMKQLTGGDAISARFMRGEWFQFEPTFKIFMAANHRPQIATGDDFAVWRRIKVIPFTERIEEHEKDPRLVEKLRSELAGILAWAVRGCLEWQAKGMQEPAAVRASIEAYRSVSDVIGRFIEESCVLKPTAQVKASQLYAAYAKWCEENGHRPMSSTKFGELMGKREGIEKARSGGIQYLGIGVCYPQEPGLGKLEESEGLEPNSDMTVKVKSHIGLISDNHSNPSDHSKTIKKDPALTEDYEEGTL
jgi:P4 family phage/plasmid primase-like protien